MIKICVKNQKIESISMPPIVAGSVDYITASFYFNTSEWDGMTKYAHFSNGTETYDIELIDNAISEDRHLNFTAGGWSVWVHGSIIEDGELKQRITTGKKTFNVQPTGTTETDNPFPSAVPSITEQLMAEIGNLEQLDTANKQTLVDAINEALRTAGGEISPEQIAEAVKAYLEENLIEIIADHAELTGRDKENQHPIGAVEGLQEALDDKQPKGNYLTSDDLQTAIYKVGDIFISAKSTSPAERFGGVWERIKDVFLLAAGDTYAAGATGGEASHLLTEGEMPQHEHGYTAWSEHISTLPPEDSYRNAVEVKWENRWAMAGDLIFTAGGNQPHNNMPPYLAFYMWQRVA